MTQFCKSGMLGFCYSKDVQSSSLIGQTSDPGSSVLGKAKPLAITTHTLGNASAYQSNLKPTYD